MSDPVLLTTCVIAARLSTELPDWQYADGALQRRYATAGWKASLMAAGAIAHLAEVAWHHPELELSWGTVVVKLSTHSAGGVTALDFALASKIEEVIAWQPQAQGDGLPGTPDDPRYRYLE